MTLGNSGSGSVTSTGGGKASTVPSEALLKLLAPDGYYTYLGIEKVRPLTGEHDPVVPSIDEELIKKNYRKLSLRHHPDRPTGDADTFRVLNRAQKVLSNPKLRQQYDLIGLDLDDEDDDEDAVGDHQTSGRPSDENGSSSGGDDGNSSSSSNSNSAESIMSQIASATLASIFQVMVRTVMMGFVSVVLVRFRLLLYPACAFMMFVAYRVRSFASMGALGDTMSPLLIVAGLILMHRGRTSEKPWNWSFWAGEILVMIMFTYNSVPHRSSYLAVGVAFFATLLTLWLRGNVWKYMIIVALEAFVAILAALAFPVMEMILEQILNDKLRRVGEKVRAHSERLEAFYGKR